MTWDLGTGDGHPSIDLDANTDQGGGGFRYFESASTCAIEHDKNVSTRTVSHPFSVFQCFVTLTIKQSILRGFPPVIAGGVSILIGHSKLNLDGQRLSLDPSDCTSTCVLKRSRIFLA